MKKTNKNYKIRGGKAIIIVILMLCSIFMSPFLSNIVSATHYTKAECQSLINTINATLTRDNATLCYFNGSNGHPSNAVNYSTYIDNQFQHIIFLFNVTLNNFSKYPDLLDSVYINLTEIKNQLNSLNNNFTNLYSQQLNVLSNSQLCNNYITERYNRSGDANIITAQLENNPEFMNKYNNYINTSMNYIFYQNNLTTKIYNISGYLYNRSRPLFNALIVKELSLSMMMESSSVEINPSLLDSINLSQEYNGDDIINLSTLNETADITISNSLTDSTNMTYLLQNQPKKMLTHNILLTQNHGLEKAIQLAQQMSVDYLRYDFNWNNLDTNRQGRWLWVVNDGNPNYWRDTLHPALIWTKTRAMSTLVVTKCSESPVYKHQTLKNSFDTRWNSYSDWNAWNSYREPMLITDEKHPALWAAWAEKNQIMTGDGPFTYLNNMISEMSHWIGNGYYRIVGFNIENEPNVNLWPIRDNFKKIDIPIGTKHTTLLRYVTTWKHWATLFDTFTDTRETVFTTYTTAQFIKDMLEYIKTKCLADQNLRSAVTIVNLHSYDDNWNTKTWRDVGYHNPNLDILGIDIYPTHPLQSEARGLDVKKNMQKISGPNDYNKPWWVVEMEGAPSPITDYIHQNFHSSTPDVPTCKKWAEDCKTYGAATVGFYRLWGTYSRDIYAFDSAYNIYQNPGNNPTETIVQTQSYATMIKNIFEN